MKRLELSESATMRDLYDVVASSMPQSSSSTSNCPFLLASDPQGKSSINCDTQTLANVGLKHGDIVFMIHPNSTNTPAQEEHSSTRQDSIDAFLEKQDGLIRRKRDLQYCKHGEQGMCSHCQPLEPYDPKYMEEKGIKHLSFQAYLRKLKAGKQSMISLEEPDYRIRKDCSQHLPYPAGICTKCQPSPITLNLQPFRLTDYVEFEQANIVDEFLAGWRSTGYQRFAWLFGRYEPYYEVPLGVKAVVCAIYEPPQDGSIDGFQLLSDTLLLTVERAASLMGLVRIGMMYTDLRDDGTGRGKVQNRRNAETFFVSSAECIFIGQQQLKHASPSPYTSTGTFGSKFVTVIISGDAQNDVGLAAYQVSLGCMAMVKADLIEATTDPSLMMVKPTKPGHYVPEVFYKHQNEYGTEVQMAAQPTFPVEYLLVTLSHGFPLQSDPLFTRPSLSDSHLSDSRFALQLLANRLLPLPKEDKALLGVLANFGLIVCLILLSIDTADFALLAGALQRKNTKLLGQFLESASWSSLLKSLQEQTHLRQREHNAPSSSPTNSHPTNADLAKIWACSHCTFINHDSKADHCEVCGLPRSW